MRTIRAAFERNAGQRLLDKLPMLVGEQFELSLRYFPHSFPHTKFTFGSA